MELCILVVIVILFKEEGVISAFHSQASHVHILIQNRMKFHNICSIVEQTDEWSFVETVIIWAIFK
jgi:hypothetical protein